MTQVTSIDLSAFQPEPDLLRDRVILITGAGSGIGAATAEACAASGATVILLGRTQEKLEQVDDRIRARIKDAEPVLMPFDLESREHESYHQIATAIEQQFGRLDGLVHSGAVLGQRTPIEQYNHAAWERVFQINVHGGFHLTRALLPLMKRGPQGRIVFLSSSVGRQGRAYWGAYAASKFAVEGLSETLADELKSQADFCVNVVNPGRTRTAMRVSAYPAEDPATVPTPESHVPLMLYLLSHHCSGQTGQSFDAQ
ncbi:YciK family oxidoreductase [Natronospirillum operosum]|uniref:YciK family oxidoreductase n=1 Tax=Natronospirillum operosum TaxID=2759953 RepID=A0A4Z0WK04_9GAMM|nr:YciK family oxidoreductase [Natronospirillum operosum]TGG95811.1 YciK family oxidoreductase [Natronospirillum operosum]